MAQRSTKRSWKKEIDTEKRKVKIVLSLTSTKSEEVMNIKKFLSWRKFIQSCVACCDQSCDAWLYLIQLMKNKDYALSEGGGGKWCVEHLCYIYTMLITIGSLLIDIYNLVFAIILLHRHAWAQYNRKVKLLTRESEYWDYLDFSDAFVQLIQNTARKTDLYIIRIFRRMRNARKHCKIFLFSIHLDGNFNSHETGWSIWEQNLWF